MSEVSPEFKSLLTQLDEEKDAEVKLNCLIEFMEASLSQSGTPRFKNFWDARKLSLELFKAVENPQVRTQLWTRYSELSKEARRLKDLLDEESAFNVEQIEIAISALEQECQGIKTHVESLSPVQIPFPSFILEPEYDFYEPRQRELNLLNAYASRINALRKELIRTEMRIRQKNKFFQRLSEAGDLVFPARKTLIEEISHKFREDVNRFVATYFSGDFKESPFRLRDEIRALQGAAKVFTLSAQVFKETRLELSTCWDKLKEEEKELKKHRQEQREIFKANYLALHEKLAHLKSRFESKELNLSDTEKEVANFQLEMRQLELGRDEVRALKEELSNTEDLLRTEARKEEEERQKEASIREQEKKEKILNFKNRILALLEEAPHMEVDVIQAQKESLLQEINASSLNRHDKVELEKVFKALKDILTEKNEQRLLNLPENDRQALDQLRELLKERKVRRQELRDYTDELRKNAGASNLDFGRALEASRLLAEEKEKLEKLNASIKDLEAKIAAYEAK